MSEVEVNNPGQTPVVASQEGSDRPASQGLRGRLLGAARKAPMGEAPVVPETAEQPFREPFRKARRDILDSFISRDRGIDLTDPTTGPQTIEDKGKGRTYVIRPIYGGFVATRELPGEGKIETMRLTPEGDFVLIRTIETYKDSPNPAKPRELVRVEKSAYEPAGDYIATDEDKTPKPKHRPIEREGRIDAKTFSSGGDISDGRALANLVESVRRVNAIPRLKAEAATRVAANARRRELRAEKKATQATASQPPSESQ
jgi:hypothetical protein